MNILDLPESHVRLVFAVQLHRAGLLDDARFRTEVAAAFGDLAGAAIADRLLALARASTAATA